MVVIKANTQMYKDAYEKRVRDLTEQYENGCIYLLPFEEWVEIDDDYPEIKYVAQECPIRSEGVTCCVN